MTSPAALAPSYLAVVGGRGSTAQRAGDRLGAPPGGCAVVAGRTCSPAAGFTWVCPCGGVCAEPGQGVGAASLRGAQGSRGVHRSAQVPWRCGDAGRRMGSAHVNRSVLKGADQTALPVAALNACVYSFLRPPVTYTTPLDCASHHARRHAQQRAPGCTAEGPARTRRVRQHAAERFS